MLSNHDQKNQAMEEKVDKSIYINIKTFALQKKSTVSKIKRQQNGGNTYIS